MALPQPDSVRWRPLRGGLLNLYLYQDEQFVYEQGRLLLRGNNGTGKSRVMALQLPFLLDGEISPHRVEPDGDPSKRIEWHLLLDGKYSDRVGYTWLELGRLEGDEPRYCTLGCGMKAVQGKGAPTRWYFITTQRVGESLDLETAGGAPLSRKRLIEAVVDGAVFDKAAEYRRAIDARLFHLGAERYRALLDLLIELRRPQLSRKLDADRISDALSSALAPLSDTVLADVAESFRGLEVDRAEVARQRETLEATQRCVDVYRRYGGVVLRRAAAEVRQCVTRFDATSRELRESREQESTSRAELDALRDQIAKSELHQRALQERQLVLRSDPAMRDAQQLHDASIEAKRCAARVTMATQRVADAKARLERASSELLRGETSRADALSFAREAEEHVRPELESVGCGAVLLDTNEAAQRRLEERRGHGDHLRELHQIMKSEERERDAARSTVDRLEAEHTQLREDLSDAQRTALDERETLTTNAETWCDESVHLRVEISRWLDELATWEDEGCIRPDPWITLLSNAYSDFAQEHSRLLTIRERELHELQRDREALHDERRRLEAGVDRGPDAPPRRDPNARRGRPGAPLWALVDFAGESTTEARGAIEGALEAAGLLDAWVAPDGDGDSDDTYNAELPCDTFLVPQPSVEGPTLADVLVPSIDRDDAHAAKVSEARVGAILSTITLAGAEATAVSSSGGTWVESRGRFGMGVLLGRASKADAVYIGHAARARSRRRRIEEIARELATLSERIERAEREIDRFHADLEGAQMERDGGPRLDAFRLTVHARDTLEIRADEAQRQANHATRAFEAAATSFADADAILRNTAADLNLRAWLDDLPSLQNRLLTLPIELRRLFDLRKAAADARDAHERLEGDTTYARRHFDAASAELAKEEAELASARARHQTLEETVGARVQDLESKLEVVRAKIEETTVTLGELRTSQRDADRALGEATGLIRQLEHTLEQEVERRNDAVLRFQRQARTGLWRNVDASLASHDPSRDWAPTRALAIAREAERRLREFAHDERALERLSTQVVEAERALADALFSIDVRVVSVREAGVHIIRIPWRGQDLGPSELAERLSEDIDERARILDEHEREILENYLLQEVTSHLQERLIEGDELVKRMNEQLLSRPLSTGMRLRFRWKPADDDIKRVRRVLQTTSAIWTPEQRDAIGTFLHERIRRQRDETELGSWLDHLRAALDYRAWHRFVIDRQQDGKWKELTKRTYGTGSGGEKAIALTLPQLAAASAHYDSAGETAPRLILMDEAFVGVDADMRAKCMGLLAEFDLDFVMTSEREWGCYPTVPGLAIYQLVTRPGLDAVHATRWVWNGTELDHG